MAFRLIFAALLVPATALAAPAPFAPGEAFTYSFQLGPFEAGRARMAVGYPAPDDKRGGVRVATVNGDAHAANFVALLVRLDDTYVTAFDADRLLSLSVTSDERGLRVRHIESEMEGGRRLRLALTRPGRTDLQRRLMPGIARDPVATLFWLRAQRLADGDVLDFFALDGASLYNAHGVVAGRETIEHAGKKLRAIRIDITAQRVDDVARPLPIKPRRFRMYLGDDDARVPYRVSGETDIGEARVELTSYTPGKPVADEKGRRAPIPVHGHVNSAMVRGH